MTIPVPSGYPDFGRYQAQATKIYVDTTATNFSVTQSADIGYVGDVPHLGLVFVCSLGRVTISVNFYASAAHTTVLMKHNVVLHSGDRFSRTLPVLGPYCQIDISPDTAPATVDYRALQAVVPYVPLDPASSTNILFSAADTAFAAATTDIEGVTIAPGEAILYAELPAVAAEVRLNGISAVGGSVFITRVKGNGITAERHVFLPSRHLRLQIVNPGPGNQNFTFSLTSSVSR